MAVMLDGRPMTKLRVADLAAERNLSLDVLAKRAGVAKQNVRNLAVGKPKYVHITTLNNVAWALNVRVSDLFEGDPEPPDHMREPVRG